MQITNLNFLTVSFYLIISIFVVYRFFVFYKKQVKINKKYLGISRGKYFYVKYIFLILSFLVIFLFIFGIRISTNEKNKINGVDVVFVLDVSKSMNVADISDGNYLYTRLDFAKKAIADFVSKNLENRYSLVIFSGEAISTVPLTSDNNVFLTLLQSVDYKNLTKQGSDFKKAFALANNRFYNSEDRSKVIVFISDGADEDVSLDLEELYDKNIVYLIAGVGTDSGGKIITGKNAFGEINYQIYNGKYVVSKLNEANLKEVSRKFDGKYLKISNYDDLKFFLEDLKALEKKSIEVGKTAKLKDFSRILTMISLVFFIIFIFLFLASDKEEERKDKI